MNTKRLAKLFKALSNENRLTLYLQIVKQHEAQFQTAGECFVTDIVDTLNIGAPTISHHLKELANAELIYTEKKGKYLVCKLNEQLLQEVHAVLQIAGTR